MLKFSPNLIINLIKNLLGKGPHPLHEPSMGREEIDFVNRTIKKNFVSTKGIYVQKFEKEFKITQIQNMLVH